MKRVASSQFTTATAEREQRCRQNMLSTTKSAPCDVRKFTHRRASRTQRSTHASERRASNSPRAAVGFAEADGLGRQAGRGLGIEDA